MVLDEEWQGHQSSLEGAVSLGSSQGGQELHGLAFLTASAFSQMPLVCAGWTGRLSPWDTGCHLNTKLS